MTVVAFCYGIQYDCTLVRIKASDDFQNSLPCRRGLFLLFIHTSKQLQNENGSPIVAKHSAKSRLGRKVSVQLMCVMLVSACIVASMSW